MMVVINGVLTAVLIIVFIGIWVWAWSSKNRETFETMAKLPLEDQPNDFEESRHE